MFSELDLRNATNIRIPHEVNDVESDFLRKYSNEQDFNQKVKAKMVLDNRQILPIFGDKISSALIMSNFVPEEFLPVRPIILNSAAELRIANLPSEFVLKVNHASGGIILVTKRAHDALHLPKLPEGQDSIGWNRYVIQPDNFDIESAIRILEGWLKSSFNQVPNSVREWCYSQITPRSFVEEFAQDSAPTPRQLEFYCFHGKAKAAFFSDRSGTLKHSIYKACFRTEEMDFARIHSRLSLDQWGQILTASEAISSYTDMVRVDWLLTDNGPVFSELTNYPGGGAANYGDSGVLSNAQTLELFSDYWGEIGPY